MTSLYYKIAARNCWNSVRPTENYIMTWIKKLDQSSLKQEIETSGEYDSNFICALKTLSFELAEFILDFDSKYCDNKAVWHIMIVLLNSGTEKKDPLLFTKGYHIFCKIVDLTTLDALPNNSLHIATRFNSTIFAQKLVEKGMSLKYHDCGFTPLLYLITYTINSSFNKNMYDFLVAHGSTTDELAIDDDMDPKKMMGKNRVQGFSIHGTSGLTRDQILSKNIIEIIKLSYDVLYKFNILAENPSHPIFDLITYFSVTIDYKHDMCSVCLSEGMPKMEELRCKHSFCIDCILAIQKENVITCPLCKTVNDYTDAPFLMTLFTNLFELKVPFDITGDQLLKLCRQTRRWNYTAVVYQNKILTGDKKVREYGVKNGSRIICVDRMHTNSTNKY